MICLAGLGVAMMVVSGLVGIYYNMIIAMAIYYLFASFTSYLPWQDCNNWWNSDRKYLPLRPQKCPYSHKTGGCIMLSLTYPKGACWLQQASEALASIDQSAPSVFSAVIPIVAHTMYFS
jgi:hypothetical protein